MPYLLGIDEAGYGPNLGPFVMSLVVVRVADSDSEVDLWERLAPAVRRAGAGNDDRLVIDDSKRVYAPGGGVDELERSLEATLWQRRERPCSLEQHWRTHTLTPLEHLTAEPWYKLGCTVQRAAHAAEHRAVQLRHEQTCVKAGVEIRESWSVIVFPRQFNELVRQHDSKAAVPAWALGRLLREWSTRSASQTPAPSEGTTFIVVDKLGGRNHYQPLLQGIFPDHFVLARTEGAAESSYRLCAQQGDAEITFMPEADGKHLPVALASMLSKYLREVLMGMFNDYWQRHVPGLKPTAGYPLDAKRFWEDIRAGRERLGIAEEVLWRCR